MHRKIKFKIVSIVSIVFKTNAKEPAQNVSSSKQNSAAFLKQNIVVFLRQNLIAFLRQNLIAFLRRNIVVFSKQKLCCLLTKKILLSFLSCVFLPVFLLFYLSCFFIFPVSLSLSYFIASFSITFERKQSKKVANRQKIINFAPRIVRNAQKKG